MAAAGVVCLQEFGQYDDWRIPEEHGLHRRADQAARQIAAARRHDAVRRLHVVLRRPGAVPDRRRALEEAYPLLRDFLAESQIVEPNNPAQHGSWHDRGVKGGSRVGGKPGELFGTAVACFILAIPNRYLPILQEGKIESLRAKTAKP